MTDSKEDNINIASGTINSKEDNVKTQKFNNTSPAREDNMSIEDEKFVKLTFTPPQQNRVKDNIRMFELSSNNGGKCLFARGKCTSHGTKLVRRVGVKRVSIIGNDGRLSWQMREVTTLACPSLDTPPGSSKSVSANSVMSEGTNKKPKLSTHGVKDQSEPSIDQLEPGETNG